MRPARLLAIVAAALLLLGIVPAGVSAAFAPKVAIIVGPSGLGVTDSYRQAAEAAARIADTLTPNVVRVYSPNATWPAVKAAVTGASVVVYLGHGNGFPSRYSNTLMPRTMDGFGLNPVAGGDDVTHQYFGESFVGKLQLAPGAVVIFSHLCYASGSTEPGLPDGTFSDIFTRVDNFAASFIKAGASTVIAEGHQNPDALIAAAIRGPAQAARAWQNGAWGHNHMASYPSNRTTGASVSLDPDSANAGFYRSLVQGPGSSAQVHTSSGTGTIDIIPVGGPPSLASAGAKFGAASVSATVAPGATTAVTLPVTRAATKLPAFMLAGVRWLPLVAPTTSGATTDDGLVVGEASADVVQTATARVQGSNVAINMPTPKTPGTYVVLLTLQTSDGTAYDVSTQALLRPFTVVVPKPIDLRITGPATLAVKPATPIGFDVALQNTGTQPWGSPLYASIWSSQSLVPALEKSFNSVFSLNAVWLNTATGEAIPAAAYPLPRTLGAPLGSVGMHIALESPTKAGSYLLVLSLAVQGNLGEFPRTPLLIPATVSVNAPATSIGN
jgi:hypothetical protein